MSDETECGDVEETPPVTLEVQSTVQRADGSVEVER